QEVLPDGKYKWSGIYRTDGSGHLRLDPTDLGRKSYAISAPSPVDGTEKYSATYADAGTYQFRVGNVGLAVQLLDDVTGAGIANVEIHAYERMADGSEAWKAKHVSDAGGRVSFDLEGLGAGRTYFARAKPFGMWVSSAPITRTGWFGFTVGTTTVTLKDRPTSSIFSGVRITAYEKKSNGTMTPKIQFPTDSQGKVRFDLEGLGDGREYVLMAIDPYGNGKNYFSRVLSKKGLVDFQLEQISAEILDLSMPDISISSPQDQTKITRSGVLIKGVATDGGGVRSVFASLRDSSGRVIERGAVFRPESGFWYLNTGPLDMAPGRVDVLVTAQDSSFNERSANLVLELEVDVSPPVIEVSSPLPGTEVPTGGFYVSGRVVDQSRIVNMKAVVDVPLRGLSETHALEVDSFTGGWTLVLAPSDVYSGAIGITLYADDGAGNTAERRIAYQSSERFKRIWHLLQRSSFSADIGAYRTASSLGDRAWLDIQLSGSALPVYQPIFGIGANIATPFLLRAQHDERQIQVKMAWFWDNHFNTYYQSHFNSAFEMAENAVFYDFSLGSFRSLLGYSAKSPAMLYSLDGKSNNKSRPNENYARELLELHTIGVSGGYTQRDVEEVARAFTGWTVVDGSFFFRSEDHDYGGKSILGSTLLPGGGGDDGEKVLDLLADSFSSAKFLCQKLIKFYVSDGPLDTLLSRCSNVFFSNRLSDSQIAQTVRELLLSPEFFDSSMFGKKLKTPIQFVVGTIRQLNGEGGGDDVALELQRQGMSLFMNPSPAGYPETGDKWLSSSMLQTRARFADRLMSYQPNENQTRFNFIGLLRAEALTTSQGVVGHFLERMFGPTFKNSHKDLALSFLTEDGRYPFFIDSPDAEIRVRRLVKLLMLFPDYHFH
ncbi:DUF1800 domain-containing protein, partial [Methyloversatilis universalis]